VAAEGTVCYLYREMPESNRNSPTLYRVPRGLSEAELDFVAHVTHIQSALAILRDGRISARLVYDERSLNTTRTHVVWLSPNDWSGAGGVATGTLSFDLIGPASPEQGKRGGSARWGTRPRRRAS